jgi:hypothetical protein
MARAFKTVWLASRVINESRLQILRKSLHLSFPDPSKLKQTLLYLMIRDHCATGVVVQERVLSGMHLKAQHRLPI